MKAQLETLVMAMYRSGMRYADAVAEFKKAIVEHALRETRGHQVNAAQQLGMHRNTFSRLIAELRLDAHSFRPNSRRPPKSESGSASNERASG